MPTLYAWRNGAAAELTSAQQAALTRKITQHSSQLTVAFADDGATLEVPDVYDTRGLRQLCATVNAEHARWDRGADPRIIISEQATPETLAEQQARYTA